MLLLINHAASILFVLCSKSAILLLLSACRQNQLENVFMSFFPLDILQAKYQKESLSTDYLPGASGASADGKQKEGLSGAVIWGNGLSGSIQERSRELYLVGTCGWALPENTGLSRTSLLGGPSRLWKAASLSLLP